jgi:pilus assembly protein CpaE
MHTFIVSDHAPTSQRIRQALLREGQDCPADHLFPMQGAAERLAQTPADLLVIVLPPDPERSMAVLSDLRLISPARLLVVGPASNSRLVLLALRAGAADYVDEDGLESELPLALVRLQSELPSQGEAGRIIAVLAPCGGSGSSTVAVNVAAVLAEKVGSVLLCDLKLTTGDLASLLDVQPTHTLGELCDNAARMDRSMLERSLVRHRSGVHLLAPPRSLRDVRLVTVEGVRQAMALSRNLFPYVVVDVDHSFGDEQLQALRQADVVLLVLRLDFTSVRHTQRTLEYLEDHGIHRNRVRVVVNRYGQSQEVPAAKVEEALGVKIHHYIPDDSKTVNRANNNGVPVVLESQGAKVSRSLVQLAASINGKGTATRQPTARGERV